MATKKHSKASGHPSPVPPGVTIPPNPLIFGLSEGEVCIETSLWNVADVLEFLASFHTEDLAHDPEAYRPGLYHVIRMAQDAVGTCHAIVSVENPQTRLSNRAARGLPDDREPNAITAKTRDGLDVLGGSGAQLDPAHGPMPDRADLPAALHALRANGADAHRIDQVRIALGEQIERDPGNREAIAALLARIAALAQGQIERADELAGGDLRGTA